MDIFWLENTNINLQRYFIRFIVAEKRKKTGGRTKGTPNKSTAITREIINDLASGLVDKVREDLHSSKLSPKDRVAAFIKLCEFNLPKPQTIAVDVKDERTVSELELKLRQLSEE
ncbi:MAG: hypothetical protein IJB60_09200 [Bacteroidaceae bacterium]|nr:hypothetical protein [Bacteroidaceae bacterium]MBQ3189589.1 hypothetical protein [Bacteroidaceae bacterium]